MKITIIEIGKTKAGWIEEGVKSLEKQLAPYASLSKIDLKETRIAKTYTLDRVIIEEGQSILRHIDSTHFTVALDETGEQMNSLKFAELLKQKQDLGTPITFIIGGPFGLSAEVKSHANLILSVSEMTFTHQMIRLFLLEQIYRATTINLGKEYHH
ncbi:hypothetical protein CVV38_02010 [Candidatus Peregrinibacteria bacterium HGW-Peregrinibacteria-1]|jgi:23S rRNA (pseudouridine1915-N3)-methyltransferase|nr:MAG: hypothetical protein CVV38_02010 [Candidatus Peregrinibacteria bacterium HGW-Peregrinibacteria-1]